MSIFNKFLSLFYKKKVVGSVLKLNNCTTCIVCWSLPFRISGPGILCLNQGGSLVTHFISNSQSPYYASVPQGLINLLRIDSYTFKSVFTQIIVIWWFFLRLREKCEEIWWRHLLLMSELFFILKSEVEAKCSSTLQFLNLRLRVIGVKMSVSPLVR